MAATFTQPRQLINAASTAVLLLAGLVAAPVLAAPDRGLLCEQENDPASAVSAMELSATPVSSGEELLEHHLLKRDAEAAVRGAFADEVPVEEAEADGEEPAADEPVVAEPGIHSASQGKHLPVKRQMYRRDI